MGQIANTASGLSSINDLYQLINGATTQTSGGTISKTTSSGIDQNAMNEMLKSALASSTGLAAVSGGQRSAGGYGSSVNTMLTNDLMTKSASQIAQNNKSETVTTNTAPATTTVGGASVSGTAKVAGFLAALQNLDKLGVPDKLKKTLGLDFSGASESSSTDVYSNPVDNSNFTGMSESGAPQFASGTSNGNPSLFSSSDSNMVGSVFFDPVVDISMPDFSFLESIGIGTDSVDFNEGTMDNPLDFLEGFADGGQVTTKKPSLLTTSQFNRITDASVEPNGLGVGAPTQESVQSPVESPVNQIDSIGGVGSNSGNVSFGGEGATWSGNGTLSDFGSLLSVAGALTGNRDLSGLGVLGSIIGSPNPALAAGMTAANIATKGAVGTLVKAVKDPSIATAIDIGLAAMNPAFGVVNTILGMADLNSLGVAATNAATSLSTEGPTSVSEAFSPLTQAVQTQQADAAANTNMTDPAEAVMGAIGSGGRGGNYSFGSHNSDRGPGGSSGAMGDTGGSVGSDGLADGSYINAPGDGTVDTKHIMVADGEYVLPADVVDMIGRDKLDALKAKYHTPVAVQKLQKFARK